jgi:hypothetical protein
MKFLKLFFPNITSENIVNFTENLLNSLKI